MNWPLRYTPAAPGPTFEVVIAADNPRERRLITVDQVREISGITETDASDAVIEAQIDAACAMAAEHCNLARYRAVPATLAREVVRATFPASNCHRGHELILPWRAPITSVAVTEGGVELDDAAFGLSGGSCLLRLSDGAPSCWAGGEIVVDYTAGWLVAEDASAYDGETEPVPANLQMALIDQVRMGLSARKRDPALRSENIPDVWSGSWNVAGGDFIDRSGLLPTLVAALAPFRRLVVA